MRLYTSVRFNPQGPGPFAKRKDPLIDPIFISAFGDVKMLIFIETFVVTPKNQAQIFLPLI
jgi:hypothetical protein